MKKTIIILFIFFLVSIFIFFTGKIFNNSNRNKNVSVTIIAKNESEKQFEYDWIYPGTVVEIREVIGKFVANDAVSIYSRRDGIIKDILVDVGDKVSVGQTLAVLFDVGVDNQASANINEKATILRSKNIDLQNAVQIKQSRIAEINEKIIEQRILLEEAKKNKSIQIRQIKNLTSNTFFVESNNIGLREQAIQVEKSSLRVLENNLQDAFFTKEKRLADIENKKLQIIDQSRVMIDNSFNMILDLLYLGTTRNISNNTLNQNDISIYLSAKNSSIRNQFINNVQQFLIDINSEKNILFLLGKLEDLNNLSLKVLDNTIITNNINQKELAQYRTSILASNKNIISYRSDYENNINLYDITVKQENEKINTIKNNIERQKELIKLKEQELDFATNTKTKVITNFNNESDKIKAERNTKIQAINANLEVLEKSLALIKAQEQSNIDNIQNNIYIAQAELNTTSAIYTNNKIVANFDGIISARYMNIGDMISTSQMVFDMIGVENSLSRQAPKEIHFSIPESLRNNVELGMQVEFVWVDNPGSAFTGTVWRTASQVDSRNNTVLLQAKVDPKIPLLHNSNIRVFLPLQKNYLRVPYKSIYNKDGDSVVYFLRESGNLGYRKVNIITEIGEFVDIQGENLDETYKIITTPLFF